MSLNVEMVECLLGPGRENKTRNIYSSCGQITDVRFRQLCTWFTWLSRDVAMCKWEICGATTNIKPWMDLSFYLLPNACLLRITWARKDDGTFPLFTPYMRIGGLPKTTGVRLTIL